MVTRFVTVISLELFFADGMYFVTVTRQTSERLCVSVLPTDRVLQLARQTRHMKWLELSLGADR